jgi:hypothetical protein
MTQADTVGCMEAEAAGGEDDREGGAQQHMLLNGAALENLEVLENAEGVCVCVRMCMCVYVCVYSKCDVFII